MSSRASASTGPTSTASTNDSSCSQRSAVQPTWVTSTRQTGHRVVKERCTRCRPRAKGAAFTTLPNQKIPTVGAPTA
jgi:hypothetical protein